MKLPKINKSMYTKLSIAGNLLVAISITGLSVLGVMGGQIAFNALIGCCIALGVMGLLGRFIKEDLSDDGRVFWEATEAKQDDKNDNNPSWMG